MNRLDAGYVMVRNPVYRRSVTRVPLTPDQVDLMVFITKDPSPMLMHLDKIISRYPVSFQITITSYGRDLEPNVPNRKRVVRSFREVSEKIGPERTIWRYDPIILNDTYTIDEHLELFSDTCSDLEGSTERCIFSFLEYHMKLDGALGNLGIYVPTPLEKNGLVHRMSAIASEHGIALSACCTDIPGISKRACMDPQSMREWNIPYSMADVPNRKGCGCVRTVDIGEYDTCRHDCLYCYANSSEMKVRHDKSFDPGSELLYGTLSDSDVINELSPRKQGRLF